TLEKQGAEAVFTFRNTSREALDIDPDELMERFVRGDASRGTEGSGLGLSIAKSFTELQKGTMDIGIDGDLFKVTLKFAAL
ncbi:MAG: sensor histidine kinase, partial [Clostridia bacterium]|nr:sensor histidine kinase [Clostridia bacterium]